MCSSDLHRSRTTDSLSKTGNLQAVVSSFPLYRALFSPSIATSLLLLLALPLPCIVGLSNLFFVFYSPSGLLCDNNRCSPPSLLLSGTSYLDTGLLCVLYTPPFGFIAGDPDILSHVFAFVTVRPHCSFWDICEPSFTSRFSPTCYIVPLPYPSLSLFL